jgi:hypothetical protein|tara:strand:+ start:1207 stop:1452 length:246 start_codon:yes stop_codon:yes gene_type:complete
MEKLSTNNREGIGLFCPVCDFVMIPEKDLPYIKKYDACSSCSMKWAETNLEKWKSGWRPTGSQIDKELLQRKTEFISFNFN